MKRNLFNSVSVKNPGYNVFDLSHDVKLSLKFGQLVPVMILDCIPGDKITLGCQQLLRFQPMLKPTMHSFYSTIHYWFVPKRLLWDNWTKWIANEKVLGSLPAYPTIDLDADSYTKLCDYMGLPDPAGLPANTEKISALQFAAYQCVYNQRYRDQNLQPEVDFKCTDGDNTGDFTTRLGKLQNRAWMHDYFTSALPDPQKGDPVSFPLSIEDVQVKGLTETPGDVGNSIIWDNQVGSDYAQSRVLEDESDTIGGPTGKLFIKGDDVVGNTTISDFRRATKLQEWLELFSRAGSRIKEVIWAFFGVKSPDARLQEPEYITGVKTPVTISEVLNNTGTEEAPQGDMAGHGVGVTSGQYGSYYVQEHGFIIGIMSVLPVTAYQQGIERQWIKYTDPTEHFWPQFEGIGEQAIENREIYAYTSDGTGSWGYVPRYAEYKFMNSRVAGDFRDSLSMWHAGRIFGSFPALNEDFIRMDQVEVDRIFAVNGSEAPDCLLCHHLNQVRAARKMKKYGSPHI